VLAMVGGFSFEPEQFNRATQAYRQPGSSFKADRLFLGARQWLYTVDGADGRADPKSDQGQAREFGVRRIFRSANTRAR